MSVTNLIDGSDLGIGENKVGLQPAVGWTGSEVTATQNMREEGQNLTVG